MAIAEISTKRIAISKANAQMVIIIAVASFISVFCLVAAKAVLSQNNYQARVISAQDKATKQLGDNLKTYDTLYSSYQGFTSAPTNIIGGTSTGGSGNDGNNAQIILDALPSTYDFPALTTSIQKILNSQGASISSIGGTDDQLNQQSNKNSPNPKPVSMPFTFSINNASYQLVQQVISTLQLSIRPIQIDSLTLSGSTGNMQLTVNAHTYYQPAKTVNITPKEVR